MAPPAGAAPFAYVTNYADDAVSVLDTATSPPSVVATVAVGTFPIAVGITPPPQGVPFLAFSAKLKIALARKAEHDAFALESSFTLSSAASNGINPLTEAVKLQVGTFTTTIPPGPSRRPVRRSPSRGSSMA